MPRKIQAKRDRGTYRHRGKDKDGQDIWQIRVRLGYDPATKKYKQVAKAFHGPEREVKRELTKMLRELDTGNFVDPSKETVGDFLVRWLRDYAAHNVRPKTFELYEMLVRKHITPAIGAYLLQQLQPVHIQELYSQKLAAGLSSQTVRHFHTVLREAMGHALKWGLLGRNVAEAVSPPRVQRKNVSAWSMEEAARFLEATEKSRYHALFLLAIYGGLRRGELLGLKWEDVDFDAKLLFIKRQVVLVGGRVAVQEPKTAQSKRGLVLDDDLAAALKKHKVAQAKERLQAGPLWQDGGWIFPNGIGKPLEPQNLINRHFKPLAEKAGVPPIRFHDLRHTCATSLLQIGVSAKEVAEQLGHSTTRMTLDTYSHVLASMKREAARRMGEAMRAARDKVKQEGENSPQNSPQNL